MIEALTERTSAPASVLPGLLAIVGVAAVAWAAASLTSLVSPLVAGVVLGAAVANLVTVPAVLAPGIEFGSRRLLRVGIVLLGLRLSLGDLAELGGRGLAVVAAVVAVTFVGTRWLGRRLGVPDDLGLLVATGYSICGASAIAAVDGVVHADEEETAYAITLVTLCGTLSIAVLPMLGGLIGLEGATFGSWVGGSVHDVGQVVATASQGGADALAAATVVKLTRIVLLAPLVAGIALVRRRATAAGAGDDSAGHPPVLPLFVVGFLAAVVLRSTGWLPGELLDDVQTIEKAVLTVALVALGAGVNVGRMRRLGGRPLLLGLLAWVLVAGAAYVATVAVH